jgi:hypothetical protein
MTDPFIVDVGKLNKMFNFYRGGTRIEMYNNAMLHSRYIRKVIIEEHESVWIAQRDGRTKDGNDRTQTSLIKMFTMGKKDPYKALKELNIVPVAISYEYEPCDMRKVQEYYISKRTEYKKKKNEDMDSVLKGITNYKGRIHIAFGKLVNAVIEKCENEDTGLNILASKVAGAIDEQIYQNYRLWGLNYIAYDILTGKNKFKEREYTDDERRSFADYVDSKLDLMQGDRTELSGMFYKLYANPVINRLKLKNEE